MNTAEFLGLLWPQEGFKVILTPKKDNEGNKYWVHHVFSDVESASAFALEKSASTDVYFGLGSLAQEFIERDGKKSWRSAENILSIKSFWLDIDCGESKPYPNIDVALDATKTFVTNSNLPNPFIVNSGGGLHCYWPVDVALPRSDWRKIAEQFKQFGVSNGIKADASRTSDSSSVLRVLGTQNHKYKETFVSLIQEGEITPIEKFKEAISFFDIPTDGMDTLAALQVKKDFPPSKTGDVLKGCQQITWISEHQNEVSEPLWRSMLSVIRLTKGAERACHVLSNQHPNYSEAETASKISELARNNIGPHTCGTFLSHRPEGCEGCPHKGKITSPIVLGMDIAIREQPEVEVKTIDGDGKAITYTARLPNPPEPYFIIDNKAFIRKIKEDSLEKKKEELSKDDYEYDMVADTALYPVEILDDITEDLNIRGGEVRLTYKNPRNEWREIRVNKVDLPKREKLVENLFINNLFVQDVIIPRTAAYVRAFLDDTFKKSPATIMVQHMGWVANQQNFAIGERIITPTEIKESKPARACYPTASLLHTKGDLDVWVKAYTDYFSRPGMEKQAVASFAIWGSLLMPFVRESNLMLNLRGETGLGKTTTLLFIISAFGNPKSQLLMKWKDTANAIAARSGIMHNLPMVVDEITNTDAQKIGDHIHYMSSGIGKNRAMQDGSERDNRTSWNNITVYSSNPSIATALANDKDGAAHLMRLIELNITERPYKKHEADAIIDKIRDNYGWAGLRYAQVLVKTKDVVAEQTLKYANYFNLRLGDRSEERKWAEGMAACFYGARIAKENGLHDLDVDALETFFIKELHANRGEIALTKCDSEETLHRFMAVNLGGTLVIRSDIDGRKNNLENEHNDIIRAPVTALVARYTYDSGRFVFSRASFKDFCAKINADFKAAMQTLKEKEMLVSEVEVSRLGKGTRIPSTNSRNIVVDLNKDVAAKGMIQ